MIKTKLKYHGYELSFPYEAPAAVAYMDECNPLPLEALIKSDYVLSQSMKDFIADIVTGKLKHLNGKRATTERRDFDIALCVCDFVSEGINLKSEKSGKGDTAISLTANKFNLEEDTVESIYKRIKKKSGLGKKIKG